MRTVRGEGDLVFVLVTTRRVTAEARACAAAKTIAASADCPRVRMVILDRSETHDLWSEGIRRTAAQHGWTPYLPTKEERKA